MNILRCHAKSIPYRRINEYPIVGRTLFVLARRERPFVLSLRADAFRIIESDIIWRITKDE